MLHSHALALIGDFIVTRWSFLLINMLHDCVTTYCIVSKPVTVWVFMLDSSRCQEEGKWRVTMGYIFTID